MISLVGGVFSCFGFADAPFSYVDPVSGVILLQLLLGGCIGYFALAGRKFGGFFLRLLRRDIATESEDGLAEEAAAADERVLSAQREIVESPSYRKAA